MHTNPSNKLNGAKIVPFLISLFVTLMIWFLPQPEGMQKEGWQLFAIFAGTMIGIVLKVLPMGGMATIALTALVLTKTLTLNEALKGFSSPVVWLVVMAFMVARSFVKTGLGFRVAYLLLSIIGKKSLGLAYGMAITDLVLSPAIPSNTARGGGIIFPIIKSLSLAFDSYPDDKSRRRIGAFLIMSGYHINIVTSAMFLTAMAANPMMVDMVKELGVEISWSSWALAALLPGIISITCIPILLYLLYPPEIKETPEAAELAKKSLSEMGVVTHPEWITLAVFALMLVLWIFGSMYGIDSTTAALVGVSILIVSGVLTWEDVATESGAWATYFWFSVLLMIASFLNSFGVIAWMSTSIESNVQGVHWSYAFFVLLFSYFYIHYCFASNTAHVSSMFAAFVAVGIASGVPPLLLIFSLAFSSSLSACLTHYGTGSGPILYGAGYVDLQTWWKLGAIISLFHLVVWIGIGSLWWKLLNFW